MEKHWLTSIFSWDQTQPKTKINKNKKIEHVSKSHWRVHKGLIHQVCSHKEPAHCGPSSAGLQSQKKKKKEKFSLLNALPSSIRASGSHLSGRMGKRKLLAVRQKSVRLWKLVLRNGKTIFTGVVCGISLFSSWKHWPQSLQVDPEIPTVTQFSYTGLCEPPQWTSEGKKWKWKTQPSPLMAK